MNNMNDIGDEKIKTEQLLKRFSYLFRKDKQYFTFIAKGTYCTVYKISAQRIVSVYNDEDFYKLPSLRQKHYFDSSIFRDCLINFVLYHPSIYVHTQIKHDSIVGIYRIGQLMTGNMLNLTLTKDMFFKLLKDMLSALKHIHSLGFIHSDIKPENILYTIDKKGDYVFKLCDFNLFQVSTYSKTPSSSEVYATPCYSDDRDFRDPSVDIYMLGSTLLQLCIGGNSLLYNDNIKILKNRSNIIISKTNETFYNVLEVMLRNQKERGYFREIEAIMNNEPYEESNYDYECYHDICKKQIIDNNHDMFYHDIVDIYKKQYRLFNENKSNLMDVLLTKYVKKIWLLSESSSQFISQCIIKFPRDIDIDEWNETIDEISLHEINTLLPHICLKSLWSTINFHFLMCEECIKSFSETYCSESLNKKQKQ